MRIPRLAPAAPRSAGGRSRWRSCLAACRRAAAPGEGSRPADRQAAGRQGLVAAGCDRACRRGREPRRPAAPGPRPRLRLTLAAMNFVGVRYRRGGTSAETGFDCSGFTRHVFEMSLGLVLPRRADEQAAAPGLVAVKREDLQARRPGLLQHPASAPSRTSASTSATTGSSIRRARASTCAPRHELRLLGQALHRRAPRRDHGRRRSGTRSPAAVASARRVGLRWQPAPRPPWPRACRPSRAQSAAWPKSHRRRRPPLSREPAAIPARLVAPTGELRDRLAAAAARPAHLGHRPLQLPLQLLHAEGGLRPRLRVPAAVVAAQLRGDRAPGRALRRPRRAQDPPHRRRAAAAARPRAAGGDARRSCATATATPLDLTLTTNGSLLARKAAALKAAGLGRVTVSLDAIDDAIFRRMNDADFPVADVLRGIDAAERAGLGPIKVNMVVKRGTNDQRDPADGAPLPRPRRRAALHRVHGRRRHQRLAHGRGRCRRPRSSRRIGDEFALEPLAARRRRARPRERWRYADGRRAARSARSRASRGRSAATATGPASRPKASSSSACSRATATTCAASCAAAPATRRSRGDRPDLAAGRDDRYSELRGRPQAAGGHAGERARSRCTTSAGESPGRCRHPRPRRRRPRRLQAAARRHARAPSRKRSPPTPRPRRGKDAGRLPAPPRPRAPRRRPVPARRLGRRSSSSARSAASARARLKVRHIGHVIGMMVRPARAAAPASARCSSRRASPRRATPGSRC